MLRLAYDQDADALYVRFRDERVARTTQLDSGTLADLDATANLIGVEVIRPARAWPIQEILDHFSLADDDRAMLKAVFQGKPGHTVAFSGGGQRVASNGHAELIAS